MDTSSTNSNFRTPSEQTGIVRKEPGKNYYRRRDFPSPYFSENLDPSPQDLRRGSKLDSIQNPIAEEKAPETVDPREQDNEILDPEKEYREREFPRREGKDDIIPNRYEPEEDDDQDDKEGINKPTREFDLEDDKFEPKKDTYYLTDEDGAIIDEPSRLQRSKENKMAPKEAHYYLTDEEGDIIKEPSRELEFSRVSGFARR